MSEFEACPICGTVSQVFYAHGDPFKYECLRCGTYLTHLRLTDEFASAPLTPAQIANISGYLRENPLTPVSSETLPSLRNLRTPTVAEKAAKLLRFLAGQFPTPGTSFHELIDDVSDNELFGLGTDVQLFGRHSVPEVKRLSFASAALSAAWALNASELLYLLETYLGLHKEFIDEGRTITPAGWEFVQSSPEIEGRTAFVAMWFAREMDPIFLEAIKPGIEDAGYSAYRVDQKEHNDDITDEILAGIRTSKFIVADFTGHRGGVYYEAGFAAGLGKQVVRCVRDDQSKDLHFDTRQLNHIIWSPSDLPKFRKDLTARIIGSIGKGPIR